MPPASAHHLKLHPSRWPRDCQLLTRKKHQGLYPWIPASFPPAPLLQSKGCCRGTPQLPSRQTDQPLCPGSWLPWKLPISFPVGTGCRGFSLLRSITEQVSSNHPLFPEDLPRASYHGPDPLSGAAAQQEAGAVISALPRRSPAGKSAGTSTRHLPTCPLVPLLRPLPTPWPPWPASLVCHTHTLSFPASGGCPSCPVWARDPLRPSLGWVLGS